MDKELDDLGLDSLLASDDGAADDGPHYNGLCVFVRAASSQELEERERAYLQSMKHPELLNRCALWPIPFLDENGEAMLSKQEIEQLETVFHVTESEYRQLVEVQS